MKRRRKRRKKVARKVRVSKKIRGRLLKRSLVIGLLFIAIFGLSDAIGIRPFQNTQDWSEVHYYQTSFWILGFSSLFMVSVIYYSVTKDKSEAVAVFLLPFILILSGLEDLLFYVFSMRQLDPQMCWFTGTQSLVSRFLGETCVTPGSLVANVAVGVVIAIIILIILEETK